MSTNTYILVLVTLTYMLLPVLCVQCMCLVELSVHFFITRNIIQFTWINTMISSVILSLIQLKWRSCVNFSLTGMDPVSSAEIRCASFSRLEDSKYVIYVYSGLCTIQDWECIHNFFYIFFISSVSIFFKIWSSEKSSSTKYIRMNMHI